MYKYLIVLALFASCANPKKLHRMMDKLPVATAQECNQRFPIKETVDTIEVTDDVILQAYQDEYARLNIVIDSLLNSGCDTVVIDSIRTVIKQLPAKTNTRIVVKTQESTAKLQTVKDSCNAMVNKLLSANENQSVTIDNISKSNSRIRKQNIWLWVVLIVMAIWMNRKRILSLLKGFV